jgi:WD40 repeat protein
VIAAVDVASPYKGLAPFEDSELDALLFFGRERESELVAMNIMAARLTVLYGPTGVGKSSLLRAGVARRLRDLAPGAEVALFSSWRDDPVAALREVIAPGADGSLADAVARRDDDDLYLVLDQFEEYFLYHGDARDESTLVAQLPDLVNSDLRVNVLLGIREDSLAKLDAFKARLPRLFGNYLRLDHLDRNAGRAAILGPLARYGELSGVEWGAQPELVETVLDEVAAGRIDLRGTGQAAAANGRKRLVEAPFLQLVLQRLWEVEHARGSTTLTLETLRGLGGAERIVEDHLDRAMDSLTPAEQDAAAVMFDHLVTPSGTKIAHRLSDLATYASLETAALASVVGALEHERILRPLRDGTNGDGSYEIYHDVLAEAVRAWRQRYETQRQLRLERRRARDRNRRLFVALGIAAVALAVMTALTVYAFSKREEAQQQAALAQQRQAQAIEARQDAVDALQAQKEAKKRADTQAALAKKNAQIARKNEQRAEDFAAQATQNEQLAQESADRADANAAEAARNEEAAVAAQQDAEENAAQAEAATANAQEQAQIANSNKQEAQTQKRAALKRAAEARRANRRAQQAKEVAQVGAYVAQAETALNADPRRSIVLALRAARLQTNPAVEDVLRRGLVALRVRAIIPSGGREVTKVTYSNDGALIALSSDSGVRVLRARDFKLLHRFAYRGATTVAFDPRGSLVASGARDGSVRVWDVSSGASRQTLTPGSRVISLEFSPDGRLLLAGGQDGVVHRWDVAAFIELPASRLNAQLRGARFSPDGRFVLAFTAGAVSRVLYAATGARVAALTHQQGPVSAGAWSPNGETVTTAGPRNVYVWDAKTWERRQLLSHGASVAALAYSADGSRVVSVGSDGEGRIWSIATGETVATVGGQLNRLVSVAYSRSGLIATGSRDQTARVWFVGGAGRTFTLLAGHSDTVSSVDFAPNGANLITGGADGEARVWSTAGDPQLVEIDRHAGGVTTVAASRDGSRILSGGLDGAGRIWRSAGAITLAHGGKEVSAAFDSKERRVLTWGDDGTAKLWALGGTRLAEFNHGAAVAGAAMSSGGSLVATAGDDGAVRVWSAAGAVRWSAKPSARLVGVAFSPDGAILATAAANGLVQLWNARTGAVRARLEGHTEAIADLVFSPGGRRLATASLDGSAGIWNVARGALEHRLDLTDLGLTSVDFSPDGKRLLTSDRDGDAAIWAVATGSRVRGLRAHGTVVQDARYSRDGRWILTAAGTTAGLWDARTGKLIFFLRGHTGAFETASFSGDGRWIVTGGQTDGTVRRYRCRFCAGQSALMRIAQTELAEIARANRNAAG